jgi:hypothetical protein
MAWPGPVNVDVTVTRAADPGRIRTVGPGRMMIVAGRVPAGIFEAQPDFLPDAMQSHFSFDATEMNQLLFTEYSEAREHQLDVLKLENRSLILQNSNTFTAIQNDGKDRMSLADWRWAAHKGYWNAGLRCWNEDLGGRQGYLSQRKFRARKKNRQTEAPAGTIVQMRSKLNTPPGVIESLLGWSHSAAERSTCNSAFSLNSGQPLLDFMIRHGWDCHAVRRYWNVGNQAGPIMQTFSELPPALREAIGGAIDSAQLAAISTAQHMVPIATATSVAEQHHRIYPAGEWEHDSVHAFFEFLFDPKTQTRVGAAANARSATLLGIEHAELLERLEKYDVPLPLAPLDAVALFLHALGTARDAVTTCYCRLSPSAGQSSPETMLPSESLVAWPLPPTVLVCSTTVKDFDAFGRVQKVSCLPPLLPPTQPHHASLVVAVLRNVFPPPPRES